MAHPLRTFVEGSPALTVSTPAQTSVGVAAGLILGPDPKRKGFFIQNTGTTVIKICFGSTDPTQTVYHVALRAATAGDDGTGGTYFEGSWVGEGRAISSGVGGTCVITQFRTGSPDWNQAGDYGQEGF